MKKNQLFNTILSANPKRNLFDMSHEKLLSLNIAGLYPFFYSEIMPNDSIRLRSEILLRFHPLVSPVLSRINVYTHFFYVPWRMVWKNFEEFITGGEDGTFTAPHPIIKCNNTQKADFAKGKLPDYLGIPPVDNALSLSYENQFNALPFRAYQLIFNEYYRDQNLESKVPISTEDTVTTGEQSELCIIRGRSYSKDYFTSALTDTQRGGSVLIPIDPVVNYKPISEIYQDDGNPAPNGMIGSNIATGANMMIGKQSPSSADGTEGRIENIASITNATATIEDLRRANVLQKWLERNARGGSRMAEWLLNHFSVKSDDLRLSRPLYLSGSKQAVSISEVLANFGSADIPQGEMAGHGISIGKNNGFKHYFKEYGCVIGIMSVIPEHMITSGVPRTFIKTDKFSYCHPAFANIGEQPIFKSEVHFNPEVAQVNHRETWGYQSRYAEMKSIPNSVHGDFRDDLSFWHTGRHFTQIPPLNSEFVKVPGAEIENKIFPVTDSQATNKLYCMIYNDMKTIRALPKYGTPTL